MKFVKIHENEITKVILDLEGVTLPGYKLNSEDKVCTFEGTHDFDFTIVNEFLASQNVSTLNYIALILTNMRRCIANFGYDDPAADECVGELSRFMKNLFDDLPMSPTGNLFGDLYNFSAKYTTPGKRYTNRQMLVATSLLSALCVMVIHDFETHFTDVSEPFQVLYPVFEEAIRACDIAGAKEFVEENRALVSGMEAATASWVVESIYINDCMLRKYEPQLPIDRYIIEKYTQRLLSSKMYVPSKRIKEMKEINEAEEQQRNDEAKAENNETKGTTSNVESDDDVRMIHTEVADTATIVALMIKQVILDIYGTHYEFCNEVVKCINRFIAEINDGTNTLHELGYCHPLASAEKIVNYVYDNIKLNIDGGKCGDINKYLAFSDFIRNGIIDVVATMPRVAASAYMYDDKMYQKYTPYKVLADRLNALRIVMVRLNPDIGGILDAVINACDNIDVSQLTDILSSQSPVQYDQFGRPIQQDCNQYYKSPFPTFESFVKGKHSTKKQ